MAERRAASPSGVIDRALAVLDALAASPEPSGITEVARQLGLSKSVVHYHLTALVRNRYVEAHPDHRYSLGAAALRLGRNTDFTLELRSRAFPYLRALHEESSETVTLTLLVGRERVYIDQLVSPQEIKMAVELGRPFPLHAGASGRVMLAFTAAGFRETVLAGPLQRLTTSTVTDPVRLAEELARIRESGVASSVSERQHGAASVAAAIFDRSGVIGSMSVCGPEYRFGPQNVSRYAAAVGQAAQRLSAELGWSGSPANQDVDIRLSDVRLSDVSGPNPVASGRRGR